MNKKKLLKKVLTNSRNISFDEFRTLVEAFGFELDRTSGSHHIFKKHNVRELINIQSVDGKAKPYQIKQFLILVERYNLQLED